MDSRRDIFKKEDSDSIRCAVLHYSLLVYTMAWTSFGSQSFVGLVLIGNRQHSWEVNHIYLLSPKRHSLYAFVKTALQCLKYTFIHRIPHIKGLNRGSKASGLYSTISCPPVLSGTSFIESIGSSVCCVFKAMGTLQQCLFAVGLLPFISFLMFFSYSYPFPPTTVLIFFFVFFNSV